MLQPKEGVAIRRSDLKISLPSLVDVYFRMLRKVLVLLVVRDVQDAIRVLYLQSAERLGLDLRTQISGNPRRKLTSFKN